ncbi:MAG: chemotaxis protein CheW [Deltaproteobacteria bacterium]|nr:chemotaxis protein CheW [Deltaproteobacteria bacterium]
MSNEILEEFIQEGLTTLDEAIDKISPDGCSLEGVNAIFRALHTLKGGCGFLGITHLANFVHQFEEILKKWQKQGARLCGEEGQKVLKGLRLVQEALVKAADPSVLEQDEYKNYFYSLRPTNLERISLSRVEELLGDIKKEVSPDKEGAFLEEISIMVNQLEQILTRSRTTAQKVLIPLKSQNLEKVLISGIDVTESCRRTLAAFAQVLDKGKMAFEYLERDTLDQDLAGIGQAMNKVGFLLTWDIIYDLCDISPEIINEAFRRFWTEGVAVSGEISLAPEAQETEAPQPQADNSPVSPKECTDSETESIEEYVRVSSAVIKRLSDDAGDLVADRNTLENLIAELAPIIPSRYLRYLKDNYTGLDKHVNSVEHELGRLSNRQLSDVFNRLPGMVEKLCADLGKRVSLKVSGGEIEAPRELLRALGDPLVHIVRNSLDHGFETPEERTRIGKNPEGTLVVTALRNDDRLTITIQDDGRGIDPEAVKQKALNQGLIGPDDGLSQSAILNLIFLPGFSMAKKVTDVSGRGVGMDVVRSVIESKGGRVHLDSRLGEDATLELTLPLKEAQRTQDVLLIQAGVQTFGVGYQRLKEIIDMNRVTIHSFKDDQFFQYGDQLIPYINLSDLFFLEGKKTQKTGQDAGRIMVVEDEQKNPLACKVDRVLRKVKVVVTPFTHDFLKDNPLVRGSAVLGTGEPYLIIDFRDVTKFVR